MLDVKTLWNFYTITRSGEIRLLRDSMIEKYAWGHKNNPTWLYWEIEYIQLWNNTQRRYKSSSCNIVW